MGWMDPKRATKPPHYTSLSLKNFRGFDDRAQIQLAPLTFLVGPNSSGKSSICDALLFLAQSRFPAVIGGDFRPNWSGELVDLGSFRDAVHRHDISKVISIGFDVSGVPLDYWHEGKALFPNVGVSIEVGSTQDDLVGFVTGIGLTDRTSGQALKLKRPKRPRAKVTARIFAGARDASLPLPEDVGLTWKSLHSLTAKFNRAVPARARRWKKIVAGAFAESWGLNFFITGTERVTSARGAPQRWYARNRAPSDESRLYETVDPTFLEPRSPKRRDWRRDWRRVTSSDLAEFLKELDIADRIMPGQLGPYHSAIYVRDNITGIESSLIDVGFGASQVIPVLAACLNPSKGRSTPLIVEQPEIHLHPRAQGLVAQLLARTSRTRQVIVETHSEHMINKARIMVAEGHLDPANVMINYVGRDKAGSHVTAIPLTNRGEFAGEWPMGFFDERYQDTLHLMKLKSSEQKGKV